jgi:hypothetical protein
LRFEIHLLFLLVFGGGATAVDWHKVMVVGYWQYWALGVVLLYKIEFLNLFWSLSVFLGELDFRKTLSSWQP